jgi:hypothetical protein
MKRKCIAILAIFVLMPALVFAVPVVVTWEWLLEDPMVTTFRYQLDGEDDDSWTVVDASVNSYTERGLDGTRDYSLYLQQSYDGIHFSESAVSVALAMFPPEDPIETMVAEEPVVVAEEIAPVEIEPVAEEIVAAEEIAPVEIEPVAEEIAAAEEIAPVEIEPVAEEIAAAEEIAPVEIEPVAEDVIAEEIEPVIEEEVVVAAEVEPVAAEEPKEKKVVESRSATMISLGGTFNYTDPKIGSYHRYNFQAELGVALKNMITFNDKLGLGVDLAVAYTPYLTSGGWRDVAKEVFGFDFATALGRFDHGVSVSAAPMLNIDLGKVDLNLGVGGFFTWLPDYTGDYLYGAFAKGSLEYKFNNTFRMGVGGKYGFVLSETGNPQFAEGTVYMGFSF